MRCYLKAFFVIIGWIIFLTLGTFLLLGLGFGLVTGIEYLSMTFYPMLPVHIMFVIMGLMVLFVIGFCLSISVRKLSSYEEYLGKKITYKRYLQILFGRESAIGNSERGVLDIHTSKFKLRLMSLTNPVAILLFSFAVIAVGAGIIYLWTTYTTTTTITVGCLVFLAIWVASAKEICKKDKK